MDSRRFTPGSILLGLSAAFVLATLFFGAQAGFDDSDIHKDSDVYDNTDNSKNSNGTAYAQLN